MIPTLSQAASLTMENPDYVFNLKQGSSVNYISTTGCKEMITSHGIGISLPGTKSYREEIASDLNDKLEVEFKGKESVCRFRAYSVSVSLSPVNGKDQLSQQWVKEITLNHQANNKKVNNIKLKCQRKEYPSSLAANKTFTLFQCKFDGRKEYNSSLAINVDLTKDTNITIETDSDSLVD